MIWALLLGAVPLDRAGAPLKLYLTHQDVVEHFRSVEPKLAECGSHTDQTLPFKAGMASDGKVELSWVGVEPTSFTECARRVMESIKSPVHHGATVHVSTTLYVRNGETFVSPSLTLDTRHLGPLMLFVAGDRSNRDAIMEYLTGTSSPER